MRYHVEVIKVNGELLFRHPMTGQFVPAPKGMKQGQRFEWAGPEADMDYIRRRYGSLKNVREAIQEELPLDWEDRPKL
jgi:hypothetical protein